MKTRSAQKKKQKKYTILTEDDKQEIIQQYYKHPSQTSLMHLKDKYKTSIKNIRRWIRLGFKRKKGCGRKKLNEKAEELLEVWVKKQCVKQKKRVSRQQIKAQAIKFFKDSNFKASKAWQDEFVKSKNIKIKQLFLLHDRGCLNYSQIRTFQHLLIKSGKDIQSYRNQILQNFEIQSQLSFEDSQQCTNSINKQYWNYEIFQQDSLMHFQELFL
ncbi:unnamed protein product [Paramecium sonneborni]|uniref:HTH CENPB-type domain-containing protein n=1 Tax=Paramecium sonneborni TaxID=65129 RepID=A0A8S1NSE9_9CILI|nr:unnamed protein product [Paramecium sonneborni]